MVGRGNGNRDDGLCKHYLLLHSNEKTTVPPLNGSGEKWYNIEKFNSVYKEREKNKKQQLYFWSQVKLTISTLPHSSPTGRRSFKLKFPSSYSCLCKALDELFMAVV